MSQAVVSAPVARRGWLLGPVPDLLFGAGLLYVGIFLWLASDLSRAQQWVPMSLLVFLSIFLSVPHYGATLLRVYGRREDRRTYVLFSIYATALILNTDGRLEMVIDVGELTIDRDQFTSEVQDETWLMDWMHLTMTATID